MTILSGIGLLTSFGAGVISFVTPCVLPLVPGYVSYVAGDALTGEAVKPLAALHLSLFFVLGFSTVFMVLGASATTIGQLLLSYRQEENLVGGAIVLLLGLFMMGVAKLSWLQREYRLHLSVSGGRPVAAYIIGVAFAFGWTPCIGPVLGAILTTSTVAATVPQGVILLGFYSLGRRAVPRRSRIHRQSDAAARRSSSAWPKPTSRRGRNRRRPGHRDPDRRVDKLFLLAARHLPDPGKDRITQGRRSWTA